MKGVKTNIKTYYVRFCVDTLHTEAEVKAYSRTDAETLLKKQYDNCKVSILKIEETKDGDENAVK
ncbi:MAG: hypothetical protein K5755_00570 [Clostridiales bacterium]|nr:hypothetical protein [Clostridiales bacterium]